MKSYKILIVTDAWHPQVNGVVRTLSYLVKELKKQKHDVNLITPQLISTTDTLFLISLKVLYFLTLPSK